MPCLSDRVGRASARRFPQLTVLHVFQLDRQRWLLAKPRMALSRLIPILLETTVPPTLKNFPVNSRSINLRGHGVGLLARALRNSYSKSTRKRRCKRLSGSSRKDVYGVVLRKFGWGSFSTFHSRALSKLLTSTLSYRGWSFILLATREYSGALQRTQRSKLG
jgi:hypothetical protein